MASTWKTSGIPALGWWLMAVGGFRCVLTLSCFFGSASAMRCKAIYPEMSSAHERTIGVWTLLSSTLCFLCAFNLDSKPLYAATFMSFVYAIGYLTIECLLYHTVRATSLVSLSFIAVTSIVWMLLQWNSHGRGSRLRGTTTKQP